MSVDQRDNPKLLMGIMAALAVIVACVFGYFWLSNATQTTQEPEQTLSNPSVMQSSVATDQNVAVAAEQAPASTQTKTLVDEALLQDAVPENPSLAKEELAKLDDIQAQLNDQKQALNQQHADADALIKLKEEQIKLLEAQLAQEK